MITVQVAIKEEDHPIRLVQSSADIALFRGWVTGRKALAVDTETTTHRRWTAADYAIKLVQFSDDQQAWCLDPNDPVSAAVISEVLTATRTLAFANAAFDIGVLDQAGLATCADLWPKAHDVLVMAHLLDSRGRRLGGCPIDLKSLSYYIIEGADLKAVLYTKGGISDEKRVLREAAVPYGYKRAGDEYKVLPITNEHYLRYSGADALYTFLLARVLAAGLKANGLTPLYERERRFAEIVHGMEQRGFCVDEQHARDTATLLEDDVAQIGAELLKDWGLVKPGAPAQVAAALKAHGVPWPVRERRRRDGTVVEFTDVTRKNAPSTARHVLADMNHPLAEAVLEYRTAAKALTACVRPLLSQMGHDGRVHPGFKTLGAVTGRMSCRGPNLQQLPKRKGTAERFRSCLQATEGMVIVAADLSQVEYRVAASLSGDSVMRKAFADGEDLHVFAARLVFGIDDPTEAQRDLAKGAGFGRIYGAGAATIARSAKVPLASAQRVVDKYTEAFSGLDEWSRELVSDISERTMHGEASVTTSYGRIIPADPERPYAAVNYMVQGTARDVLVDWVFNLPDTEGLIAIIHDELVFEAAPEHAEELARLLEKAASQVDLPGVPVVAEAKVGARSWGSLYRKDLPPVDTERGDEMDPEDR